MKDLHLLDVFRIDTTASHGWKGDGTCGAFQILSRVDGQPMLIQASSDEGWDHVSVSRKKRTPTWGEMEQIRDLFFKPEEVVMQLHVARSNHINVHPHCLHLWRPHSVDIPLPPKEFV